MATSVEAKESFVLSDVHVFAVPSIVSLNKKEVCLSRFYFKLPKSLSVTVLSLNSGLKSDYNSFKYCKNGFLAQEQTIEEVTDYDRCPQPHLDDDGDPVLVRRHQISFPRVVTDSSAITMRLVGSDQSNDISHADSRDACSYTVQVTGSHSTFDIDFGTEHEKVGTCQRNEQPKNFEKENPSIIQPKHTCYLNELTDISDKSLTGKWETNSESTLTEYKALSNIGNHSDKSRFSKLPINSEIGPEFEVLTIEHKLETSLEEVGFQVWSGALLMCDYLIHNHSDLKSVTILDLGAGTGITSIVSAMFASHVICTDYSVDILELAEHNWQRNRDLLPVSDYGQVTFKVLDWTKDLSLVEDSQALEDTNLILGAEVVYDDDLTDAFFKTVYHLLLMPPSKTVLLSVEKRVIFSIDGQDICSPAYEHFQRNLEDLTSIDEGPVHFTAVKINTEFPKYFQYQRVKELELWEISSHF